MLANKGSTVTARSGETARLRGDATDVDGDVVAGYWQQKSGISVNLGAGQTDVRFGACIAPTPNVSAPETSVSELVVNDGKDEVRLEHTLTVLPPW